MNFKILTLLGFVVATTCVACGGAPGDEVELGEEAPPSEIADLAGDHLFEVLPGASLDLEATGSWITGEQGLQEVSVALRNGVVAVAMQPDGTMALETLDLALEDIEVGVSLVTPEGGTLTDLRVRLERRAVADGGTADVDLELEWSLALPDGRVLELGSPELPALPCAIAVTEGDDGSLRLDLEVTGEGPLLNLAEAVEVTGLSLQLEGIETVGAAVE